jgi:hypothetical protein
VEQQVRDFQVAISRDGWSKLTDGLLMALVLYLLWLLVILAIRPIEQRFGQPGLLIYTLGLLAVAMFALQHAIFQRHTETARAWYGIAGGALAWSVLEVSSFLGAPILANAGGVIQMIMVSLIFMLLWRGALPLGMKFFGVTLLMNWAEFLFMQVQAWLSSLSPIFALTYRLTGYMALFGIVLAVGYILSYSRRRLQRVSAALLIWFFASLALHVFWGPLY